MKNLSFPLAGMLISLIVQIVFFTKERQENIETKIYSKLITFCLLETVTAFFGILVFATLGTPSFMYLVVKLDYIFLSAGFNEYISKSIDQDLMDEVIKRNIK